MEEKSERPSRVIKREHSQEGNLKFTFWDTCPHCHKEIWVYESEDKGELKKPRGSEGKLVKEKSGNIDDLGEFKESD